MQTLTSILQSGAQFELFGSPFEVITVRNSDVRLSPMNGGPMSVYEISTLAELIKRGDIAVKFTPQLSGDDRRSGRVGLRNDQIAKLDRCLQYVRGIEQRAPGACGSQKAIKRHIADIAKEIGDEAPPGASTIAAWFKKWRDQGRLDAALAPAPKPSRRDFSKIDPQVLEIADQAIRDLYLKREHASIRAVYSRIVLDVAQFNIKNKTNLQRPSEHIVRKIIKSIDQYEKDRAQRGGAYAARKHRAAGRMMTSDAPLEICMADGQHMDVIVCAAEPDGSAGQPLGRPYLTAIMDLRTRCILAALITLQPFCGATALKALMIAVAEAPGKPRGVMSTLIVDNGCDYKDSGFMGCVRQLDITLEVCGPRAPNGKANVERFFRTLNEDLVHTLPGTTFSNPEQRGDYRSQDMAKLTLADLQSRVQNWIDTDYHQRPHRSLGRAPIDVWNSEVQA
jgi:putative transposase